MRRAIAWGMVCCALEAATMGMGAKVANAQLKPAQNAVQVLDHGWQFRQITAGAQEAESGWMAAPLRPASRYGLNFSSGQVAT